MRLSRSRWARRIGIRAAADNVERYIDKTLRELKRTPLEKLIDQRYDRIRKLGTDAVAV